MTFCIGVRVRAGIVVLADTRVVRGSEISQKSKLSMFDVNEYEAALMTSGLRSVRDKVVARLDDRLSAGDRYERLHEFATAYGTALRAVREEDEASLTTGGMSFNSHAILGGRLVGDTEPSLFQVYPEGNWVEATDDAPYFVIGRTSYGKPILDRLLTVESTLRQAVVLAYLAFDATRATATRQHSFPTPAIPVRRPLPRSPRVAQPATCGARRTPRPVGVVAGRRSKRRPCAMTAFGSHCV